ncbi:hypothetical protein KQX54_010169 [Cotesia glomerata]|uniref:Uncharacterized protein n=1 Tax=Cotesia glomerata TaxID=32391 RepID=A0AAV7J561_COTGL|nr:hypothetical protein KQX54_010169 [Cotesia glomerata]
MDQKYRFVTVTGLIDQNNCSVKGLNDQERYQDLSHLDFSSFNDHYHHSMIEVMNHLGSLGYKIVSQHSNKDNTQTIWLQKELKNSG